MNKIIYTLVYNRKKRLNNEGKALVQVEAYSQKKRVYFSTRIYLKPEQWDNRRRQVKRHPNAEFLNKWLWQFICDIERKEYDIWQHEKTVSLEKLKKSIVMHEEYEFFTVFYRQEAEKANIRPSTRKNHLTTWKLLKEFKSEVSFADINFNFLQDFELFLKGKGCSINTIAKHLRHLKRYLNLAISKGYQGIDESLFQQYKIKSVETHKCFLRYEELTRMEEVDRDKLSKPLQHTLDAFLFCCYTGLRFSDFRSLRSNNIIKNNRETWLFYRSVKTSVEVKLPLHLLFKGKPLKILTRYKRLQERFFMLPEISNVNQHLSKLAQLAKINKHVTFHVARHTNATLLIYKGVNITTVQKLLGHRDVKTTQVYANIMDMTIINDLQEHQK